MSLIRGLAFLLALACIGAALAHGDKPRAKIDYANVEELDFGRAADPRKARRTVRVEMSDKMRFAPARITVKQDEIVRFVPTNKGKVLHEMVLGTLADLKAHAELMKKHPDMEHDDPHMAHVAPGRSGEIGWQFTKAGTYYFGCLVPGHFESGMVGTVEVVK